MLLTVMSKREIRTKEEFEALMREVDQRLQKSEVSIHGRQIAALAEVASILGISIKGGPLTTGPIPGVYSGDSLSAHIFEWTEKRYGERLRVDFSIGQSVFLLRGAAWLIRFPLSYGKFVPLCVRDFSINDVDLTVRIEEENKESKRPGRNLLRFVEDLPQTLAEELTNDELKSLCMFIIESNYFFDKLDQLGKTNELARSAHVDLNTAADHCMSGASQYGQSRWAALQACEKMLKCFIASKGKPYPHIHKLSRLANIAFPLGLPKIDDDLLAKVQCNAGIRYGKEKPKLAEVVNAIHTSIMISHLILEAMQVRKIRCAFLPFPGTLTRGAT